jgi:hypothetical protein
MFEKCKNYPLIDTHTFWKINYISILAIFYLFGFLGDFYDSSNIYLFLEIISIQITNPQFFHLSQIFSNLLFIAIHNKSFPIFPQKKAITILPSS